MMHIDGSMGEGGGQILRSSLALSLITGKPFCLKNIRARRSRPGLQRQHLAAVHAAAAVGNAEVEGAALRSRRLVFQPHEIQIGEHHFRIGTAGSTSLVLQTVLPALMLAAGPSSVTLEGGTHNPFAPPFDFLKNTYLPLIERMGPSVAASISQYGFYPAGGGKVSFHIQPARRLERLDLSEPGDIVERRVRSLVANLPTHIADRECRTIARKSGWPAECCHTEEIKDSVGPGNVCFIQIRRTEVTETFAAFGEKGVKAEQVASRVWREAKRYLQANAPVGDHLADQLLLPLGLGAALFGAGGQFRTLDLTPHSHTHIDVLHRFLEVDVAVDRRGKDDVLVVVGER